MRRWSFIKRKGRALCAAGGPVTCEALRALLAELGLQAAGLDLSIAGDRVVVTGAAADQETFEKVILAVGNVQGVAVVDEDVDGVRDAELYTVVPGDTLAAIAAARLGNAGLGAAILAANDPVLPQGAALYPGLVLRLPQGD